MTATLARPVPASAPVSDPVPERTPLARRLSLLALLAGTALLYLWDLGASGWANQFYAAAVQAGSQSWEAMLFGSSDAANAITVDKTPGALWVMDISARIFGFNSWSLLVPQALEGVAAVAVLYAAVRRVSGHWAGILAGTVLALTPVAALMFWFDNPDALLVLLLTCAAYCVLRAIEPGSSRWWLPLAGSAVGFAFLAKMMQAFLVLPAFALVYLVAAHAPLRTRIVRSLAALGAMIASAGWYIALVAVWPASSRPYIGGSQQNSILELTLGYNGFGRLTGDEVGGLGNLNGDVGWARLFGSEMGGQIAWLLPAAVILGGAGLWFTRRAPRTDPARAALLLWLGWLGVTAVVFSFANGILHPYYTVALAPAIAGAVGVGAALAWRRRHDPAAAGVLAGTVLVTTLLACVLLGRQSEWLPWLRPTIAVAGVGAAVALLVVGRLPRAAAAGAIALALFAGIAGPAAYSLATAATPHSGAIPSAGPSTGRGPGGGGAMPPGGGGVRGGGGPMGGLLGGGTPGAELTATLNENAGSYVWVAAAVGSNNAASYQLATGSPVMAVGGFNGTDPAPTLAQFQEYVAQGRIHYFIESSVMGGRGSDSGSDAAAQIAAWVAADYTANTIDGVTVYDLTAH